MNASSSLTSTGASLTGRPLRIVIPALSYFPEHKDGSSRLAYDEAKYLAERGHEVWLVGMGSGRGEPEYIRDGPLHVLRYRRPPWAGFDPTGAHQRAVVRLLKRHVTGPVDLVHAHTLLGGAAAFDLYDGRARTCYTMHSPVRAELLAARRGASPVERVRLRVAASTHNRLEARLLERADVLTCDSMFTRQLVRQIHGPVGAGRFRVLPGWVDLSRFRVLDDRPAAKRFLGWPTDRPVLFCLRRFVPRNGLEALIEAAADVKSTGRTFHLVIAGDGELRGRLKARAASLGLFEEVRFPGIVADADLAVMYGAADAFVLPTHELECFGLIAIEALACGRPVLATPVGAIPEIVRQVEPLWIAKEAGDRGLSVLLGAFLDGKLRSQPPEVLRSFVARRYSVHDCLPELARLLLVGPEAA